jgi:glycosyltransferase involved in cell wall biosynthesis
MVHNYYRERGGEFTVFEAEQSMLRDAGHSVVTYTRDSREIDRFGFRRRAALALRTIWAGDTYREMISVLRAETPEVAHFTNTFPLISPSAYDACHKLGVPVVQSIHNYRLLCPAATLWRDGAVCEECVDHSLLRSVRHACYRGSRPATAVLAAMLAVHRRRGTYSDRVDRYIALTEFARANLVAGGVPEERISVKPNFTGPDPGTREHLGRYALFAGRLSAEKGVRTLLDAWSLLDSDIPLHVAGDGPLRGELEARVRDEGFSNVTFLGAVARSKMLAEMQGARVLVFPSELYEGMPMSIVESFACGVPVIAARLGAMKEMIEDRRTGLFFSPADASGLATQVRWAFHHDPEITAMGRAARAEYTAHYTAASNCPRLIAIYEQAVAQRQRREASIT